jgi:diguanylate cyclase (GGDEF)-like protein
LLVEYTQYNDTYGHQGGDDCLKQIAQAIEKVSKRPADIVARYGCIDTADLG